MWDMLRLGLGVAEVVRESRNEAQIQRELGQLKREYPQDYPVFDDWYQLFAKHMLDRLALPHETEEGVQLIVATKTRGVLNKPFRCVAAVDPIGKETSVQYYSHAMIPPGRVEEASRFINYVNTILTAGLLTQQEREREDSSETGFFYSYHIEFRYRDAPRPPQKVLENMLTDVFQVADQVNPAFYEIARGRSAEEAQARLRRTWRQTAAYSEAARKRLLEAYKRTFEHKGWGYLESVQFPGFELTPSNGLAGDWRCFGRVGKTNTVFFEVHHAQRVPEELRDHALFYCHMLKNIVHVNERSGIVFVKDGFNARGCEGLIQPAHISNLIEATLKTASTFLVGVDQLVAGLHPVLAFQQGLRDSLVDPETGEIRPEQEEYANSVTAYLTGYSIRPAEDVEARVAEAPPPQAVPAEESEDAIPMEVPEDLPELTVGRRKAEVALREYVRAFRAAEAERSAAEARQARILSQGRQKLEAEAAEKVASAQGLVDQVAEIHTRVALKLQSDQGVPSMPREELGELPAVQEPLEELSRIAEAADRAGREIERAIRTLQQHRERQQRERLIRFALTILIVAGCILLLTLPVVMGVRGVREVMDSLTLLVRRLGVDGGGMLIWLPRILFFLLAGGVAAIFFALIGILPWERLTGGRVGRRGFLRLPWLRRVAPRLTSGGDAPEVVDTDYRVLEADKAPAAQPPEKEAASLHNGGAKSVDAVEAPAEPEARPGEVLFCMQCGHKFAHDETVCSQCGATRFDQGQP